MWSCPLISWNPGVVVVVQCLPHLSRLAGCTEHSQGAHSPLLVWRVAWASRGAPSTPDTGSTTVVLRADRALWPFFIFFHVCVCVFNNTRPSRPYVILWITSGTWVQEIEVKTSWRILSTSGSSGIVSMFTKPIFLWGLGTLKCITAGAKGFFWFNLWTHIRFQ